MPDGKPPPELTSKPAKVINPADIEPPTTITDPKAKRKMKRRFQSDAKYTGTSPGEEGDDFELGNGDELEDDEEVTRGRSRSRSKRGDEVEDSEAEVGGADRSSSTGSIGRQNYIFLGDFVDRGYFSLETFTLLMCLKAKFVVSVASTDVGLTACHQISRSRHTCSW